ncbi:hypothetical protein [Streptomyces sp. NPDC005385]|uniref:hypothetical protein n=1 Tax=Streptomyces sp. NPDC005385 TaxID=3157039 RepID=UPI0033BBC399
MIRNRAQTTETGPVHLGMPVPDPEPVDGCDVCQALARERDAARSAGDLSKVSDINIEMRNHQEDE